jgi:DNA-binding Lrp family transcriptional regulator
MAGVLGVSEQTVARRYQRMRTHGVVRVLGRPDPARLPGTSSWTMRIGCRPGTAPVLAEALARRSDTSWVSIMAGGAELACQVTVVSGGASLLDHLPRASSVLTFGAHQMLHRFAGRGESDWVAEGRQLSAAQRAELSGPPDSVRPADAQVTTGDRALLAALAADGRASYAALAAATGWSQRQVAQRLSALIGAGAVFLDVDTAVGTLGFRALATLWFTVSPADLASVGARLADHPELAFASAVTGAANLMASAVCRDAEALYRYVTTRVAEIPEVRTLEIVPLVTRIKQAHFRLEHGRLRDPAA